MPDVHHRQWRHLLGALDDLARGRGRIIELVGEPGMGKTRLLAQLAEEATARGVTVLRGCCTEFEQQIPFQVFEHTLGSRLRATVPGRRPVPPPRLLHELFVDPGGGEPAAGRLLDVERYRLYHAIRVLLEDWANGGLVLVLDDFHWADAGSTELVDYLVRWPVGAPLLLVIAQRARQASPRLRRMLAHGVERGTVDRVELTPLTLAQSASLLGLPADHARLPGLHAESGGNPLYLLALAASPPDRAPSATTGTDDQIPTQLAALLLGEVASLGDADSVVAAAAAVLGDQFDLDALTAVAGMDPEQTCVALGRLTQRDLLRPVDGTPRFSFRHPVLRRLVYADADPSWRLLAHRRALAVLSARGATAAEQAVHIERSLASPDPADLQLLTRAATEAMASAPGTAAHWLQVALRALPQDRSADSTRVELLLLLGRALAMAGRPTEVRGLLDEILRLVPADQWQLRASAVTFCAQVELAAGDPGAARALLEAELAALPAEPPAEAVRLMVNHVVCGLLAGEPPAPADVDRALALARRHGDELAELGGLGTRAFAEAASGAVPRAVATVARGAAIVDGAVDEELAAVPEYVGILAWAERLLGRFDDAARHFARSIAVVRGAGSTFLLPGLLAGAADVWAQVGRLRDAQRAIAEAQEMAHQLDGSWFGAAALSTEAAIAAWTEPWGGGGRAITLAERAVAAVPPGGGMWAASATVGLAMAHRMEGNAEECIRLLLAAGGAPELVDLPPLLRPVCFEMLVAAAVCANDHAAAAELADHAALAAGALGLPHQQAYATTAAGHVRRAQRDHAAAARRYQQAAGQFGAAGMLCQQALLLALQAQCLAETGATELAAGTFTLARELATRCGARKVSEYIGDQQRRLSDRPRRAEPPVLAALTDREREIASIAGTGKKTREIAAELLLSPRTVDAHLTRIYRKLNVSSRAALARLMGEIDLLPPEPPSPRAGGRRGSAPGCRPSIGSGRWSDAQHRRELPPRLRSPSCLPPEPRSA